MLPLVYDMQVCVTWTIFRSNAAFYRVARLWEKAPIGLLGLKLALAPCYFLVYFFETMARILGDSLWLFLECFSLSPIAMLFLVLLLSYK